MGKTEMSSDFITHHPQREKVHRCILQCSEKNKEDGGNRFHFIDFMYDNPWAKKAVTYLNHLHI